MIGRTAGLVVRVAAGALAARALLAAVGLRPVPLRRGGGAGGDGCRVVRPGGVVAGGGQPADVSAPAGAPRPAAAGGAGPVGCAGGGMGLTRSNFRGRRVSLAGGPVLAVAASATAAAGAGGSGAAAAALVAGLGAGAVGRYDDVAGARPGQQAKGFRGHLAALRSGRLTSGMIKIVGIGAAGVAAAGLLDGPGSGPRAGVPGGPVGRVVHLLLGAGVVAGTANLVNLLDLRPGRALKAGLLAGVPLLAGPSGGVVAGPLGAAAALLPADLAEEVMLGDAGANALGALLGVRLAAGRGPLGRAGVLAVLAGFTAASEKVSFTSVIEATPGLRELDALGRHG